MVLHATLEPLPRLAAALQRAVCRMGLLWRAAAAGFREVVCEALGEMGWLQAPPSPVALAMVAALLDLPRPDLGFLHPMICGEARAVRGNYASMSRCVMCVAGGE